MRTAPANVQLRRAQISLMLAVLIPTVLLVAVGILLMVFGDRRSGLLFGLLILTLCATGIVGYILVSIYLGKGASLALVQNDFVSSVSHELRTPLTAIRLFLDALREGRLTETEQREVIGLIGQESQRLEELVGRLLELTRLETGAHPFAREPVDLRRVVDDALAAYATASLSTPTPIQVEVAPDLVVLGDHATLVRALANLLVNAWKYTGANKQIRLTGAARGRWIEVVVSDNGIGIPAHERRRLFQRFTRGRAAIDGKTPGVGLGLAFVRAIVRGHRGKVDVRSREGEGAVFRLRLRRARRPATGPAQEVAA